MSEYNSTKPFNPPPPTGQPVVALEPKKQRSKPLLVAIAIACVVAVFALGSVAHNFFGLGASSNIGVISIDGSIGEDGNANSPEGLLSLLNQAEKDPSIAAVVLRVNSGGGIAASGEEMSVYVKNFSKPVVVSSGAANESAAYMISSQSDYIYANNASAIGAIGTALQVVDYSRLLDLIGVDVLNITSSDSKDSSYGTRPLTQEEIEYYQNQVNEINRVFIETVASGRQMDTEKVRELASGMSFTGGEALENGLIDEIGTFEDACTKAAQLANLSTYSVKNLDNNTTSVLDLIERLGLSSAQSLDRFIVEENITDGQFS